MGNKMAPVVGKLGDSHRQKGKEDHSKKSHLLDKARERKGCLEEYMDTHCGRKKKGQTEGEIKGRKKSRKAWKISMPTE